MELKGHLLYYPEGKHDINLDNYIQKSQLNDALKSKVDPITKTTYADLKNLRDNSKLVPGAFYRITDYQCTTTQENTRSAGHQFDIVLLALSENKLAEEGWAMEHPTDVYDVTFADGVTKKCYVYTDDGVINIVDVDTKLGYDADPAEITIDDTNKTVDMHSIVYNDMIGENLTYNYFQNSNLSAWKVWYCLDNDKTRFAWAQNEELLYGVDSGLSNGKPLKRCPTFDNRHEGAKLQGFIYAWGTDSDIADEDSADFIYSKTEHVNNGDELYNASDIEIILSPSSSDVGRGVIYRLIDEWNNDCPYDFKNILYLRQLTAGVIDVQGTDTYIPTFCLYDVGNTEYKDASIFAIYYPSDENMIGACYDNIIKMVNTSDIEECYAYELPNNIILELVKTGDTPWQTHSNIIFAKSCSFGAIFACNVIYAYGKTYTDAPSGIIFGNRQVVWEDIS